MARRSTCLPSRFAYASSKRHRSSLFHQRLQRRELGFQRSGLVAAWIDLDLTKILHGFAPELLEALRQAVRELAIPDEQRCESALLDERMVQRQYHRLVVHHVKWMSELA